MLLLFFAFFISSVQAHQCSFIPKNNLSIPYHLNWPYGISHKEFNQVIDQVSSFYEPIIKAQGAELLVNRLWQASTVNASASRRGNIWELNMFGGLARHKLMTKDAFALVMCHEVGHHLGGFPKYSDGDWASDEGQADFFATMKCFRKVFESENHDSILSTIKIPAVVYEKCSLGFKSKNEIDLCARSSMGSLQVALFLDDLRHISKTLAPIEITFDQPDTTEVNQTNHKHPYAQCRLDTYFAGAICPVPYAEDFGQDNPTQGACSMEKNDSYGYRPRCWYKPVQ
jgi:hypothetical protein